MREGWAEIKTKGQSFRSKEDKREKDKRAKSQKDKPWHPLECNDVVLISFMEALEDDDNEATEHAEQQAGKLIRTRVGLGFVST